MSIYHEEHEAFRSLFRDLIEKEAVPHTEAWEAAGQVPRDFYKKVAELGIMGHHIPEEFGGGGEGSFLYNAILVEEAMQAGVNLGSLRVHMAVAVPYLLKYANQAQKEAWLPGISSGDILTAIGLTEPGAGSDLGGMRSTARRDGDDYVLNGSKTFITGGAQADFVLVACRTDPDEGKIDRRRGISLLMVDMSLDGAGRGPAQKKIGLHAQDTVELFFENVRVPADCLIGEPGRGLEMLKQNLPQERLIISIGAVAGAERALELATQYVQERIVFGKRVADLQNTRFVLAQCATQIAAGRALLDNAILAHDRGELSPVDAAKVKLFTTELQCRVADECLQLFGGYGYIQEFPISKIYADARVARIYGGTSEIMKAIIGSALISA